jgi:hypothetical protein
MLQRHNAEVGSLYGRPYRPIGFQARNIALLELLLGTLPLQDGHRRQEDKHVGARKYALVGQDTGDDGLCLVLKVDPPL